MPRSRSSANSWQDGRAPLRFEYEIADLAHRALTACGLGDQVRTRFHGSVRVSHGHGEPHDFKNRQIGAVITDARDGLRSEAQDVEQLPQCRKLVFDALPDPR